MTELYRVKYIETLGTYGAELLIPSFTRGKKTVEPLVC